MDGAYRKREKANGSGTAARPQVPRGSGGAPRRPRGGGGRRRRGGGRHGAEPPRSAGAPAGGGTASRLLVGDCSLVSLGGGADGYR